MVVVVPGPGSIQAAPVLLEDPVAAGKIGQVLVELLYRVQVVLPATVILVVLPAPAAMQITPLVEVVEVLVHPAVQAQVVLVNNFLNSLIGDKTDILLVVVPAEDTSL
jgi:hypothetical protein